MSDQTGMTPPPPPTQPMPGPAPDPAGRPSWWKRPVPLWAAVLLAVAGIGLGAVVGGGNDDDNGAVEAATTDEPDDEGEAELPDLAEVASKHRLRTVGALDSSSENSLSLTFDDGTRGLAELEAMLEDLGFPAGTIDRIGNTRALDGTLTASAPHLSMTWSYHPDNGLSVVIDRTG